MFGSRRTVQWNYYSLILAVSAEAVMAVYRFYTIDNAGHIFGPAAVHDVADDGEALKKARTLQNNHDIEIWAESRIVGYLVFDGEEHEPTSYGGTLPPLLNPSSLGNDR